MYDFDEAFFQRQELKHRGACRIFFATIVALYIINFACSAIIFQNTPLVLCRDFIIPLLVVACIYQADWKNSFTAKILYQQLPAAPITALASPVVGIFVACLSYQLQREETVDFNITLFAALSMITAPYALRKAEAAYCAIVLETFVFMVLALYLGHNSAAMVTILSTAAILIISIPSLDWLLEEEAYIEEKTVLALVMLGCAALTVVLLECTLLMNVHSTSYMPAADRTKMVLVAIMDAGWAWVIPILLIQLLFMVSGIYICRTSIRLQLYLQVCFLTVMCVQTVLYGLICFFEEFRFPSICPFLDGCIFPNTLFLWMAFKILPPKQKKLPSDEELENLIAEMLADMEELEAERYDEILED